MLSHVYDYHLHFVNNPHPLRIIVISAIVVIPQTIIPASTYHPNKVLNQCGSIDIIQSQDIIDSVYKKNTKNAAASLNDFLCDLLSVASSCSLENLTAKNLYTFQPAINITALINNHGTFNQS